MSILNILYVCVVTTLTGAELRKDQRVQNVLKPLAALGFILIAVQVGALNSLYGQIILAGLIACAVGDVLLLSRHSEKLFLLGMGAFAVGHLAYAAAFMTAQAPPDLLKLGIVAGVAITCGVAFFLWLRPNLPAGMAWPVGIYSSIILVMVIIAFGLPWRDAFILAPIAAVMFAVSDMFVARDRFVTRAPMNAIAITPLYFSAQVLFAFSTRV